MYLFIVQSIVSLSVGNKTCCRISEGEIFNKEKGEGKEQERKKKGRNLVKEIIFVRRKDDYFFNNERELEKATAMHLISQLLALVFQLSL